MADFTGCTQYRIPGLPMPKPKDAPMNTQIRFVDGAAYERYMGAWSQQVGEAFLDWLAPAPGLRWLDVGCGNGAFTELITGHCAPSVVHGIDPFEEQLDFARTRLASTGAMFRKADAMALPFPDDAFDLAVMPLVIFFVPEPAAGVAEMVRVVAPDGIAAAYAWDMEGGGFPYEPLLEQVRDMGIQIPSTPSPQASRLDVLGELWIGAGLADVEAREITVRRTFADFEDYWQTVLCAPSLGAKFATMPPQELERLRTRLRERLTALGDGRIVCEGRANAVKGTVPGR